jgi:transcriptional regulator with XRE-family HTH domain
MKAPISNSSSTSAVGRKLRAIQEKASMKSVDIANLLGTRPETVSRWNQGKAFPRSRVQRLLLDLEYIVDQLSDFYEPQDARLWLFSRQKLLGGVTPADLIQQGKTGEVIRIIDQLRDGVFV